MIKTLYWRISGGFGFLICSILILSLAYLATIAGKHVLNITPGMSTFVGFIACILAIYVGIGTGRMLTRLVSFDARGDISIRWIPLFIFLALWLGMIFVIATPGRPLELEMLYGDGGAPGISDEFLQPDPASALTMFSILGIGVMTWILARRRMSIILSSLLDADSAKTGWEVYAEWVAKFGFIVFSYLIFSSFSGINFLFALGLFWLGIHWKTVSILLFSSWFIVWVIKGQSKSNLKETVILYLRRFNSFSDRIVAATIFRNAHPKTSVLFLIPTRTKMSDWNPFLICFAGMSLRSPLATVPLPIRTSDEQWQSTVKALVDLVDIIVLDEYESSKSIVEERAIIEGAKRWKNTIALQRSDASKDSLPDSTPTFAKVKYKRSFLAGFTRMFLGYLLLSQFPIAMSLMAIKLFGDVSIVLPFPFILLAWFVFFVGRGVNWKARRQIKTIFKKHLSHVISGKYRMPSLWT